MLKLIAIKTDRGYYITDNINNDGYYRTEIKTLKFDGEKPKTTFHKDWFIIKKFPKSVMREKDRPSINKRYELDAPEMFPKLKKIYNGNEVIINEPCSENDYTREITEEFRKIASLYTYKDESGEMIYEPIEFEFEIIGRMKNISDNTPFAYEVENEADYGKTYNIYNNDIVRNLIDKIVTPPILIHLKPCSLTSHDSYKIIRQYVKQNIDLSVAKITSDYNFCFTVQKVIGLAEEEEYTMTQNLFSKRKTKYITKYRNSREVKIFEMGWSPRCYEGYTPIKGFKGKDEKDLKKNVDKYLKDLINRINEPLVECKHCNGMGVILQEKGGESDEK